MNEKLTEMILASTLERENARLREVAKGLAAELDACLDALEPGTNTGPRYMETLSGRAAYLDRTRPIRASARAALELARERT